ncbi:hypothetical protein KPH14_005944 [Odynerus spinipes]|uniref:C2H2-type domain-containing protein n=1 Tax=Odynerus spinipes TaxID=1348599 RepID=A0AAD9RJG2_9HYME|nr:hypothetical protein KPH14_005944 [Odynerus spinipes]
MKSIKAKSKNKKNNTKFGKVKFSTKETTNVITPDLSALRKPIDISVSRLSQVSKLLENGSDEVKAILAYECDIVYECRVCRSLFRSLVNFISHKRVYCKEKFNITLNKNALSNNDEAYTKDTFIRLHIPEQVTVKENCNNDRILRSQVSKEQKKDLTTIIDMLQKKQKLHSSNPISQEMTVNNNSTDIGSLDLKENAKHKEMEVSEVSIIYQSDLTKAKTTKLQNVTNQNTEILELNEHLLVNKDSSMDNISIQPSASDEDNESNETLSTKNLICSICNAKFSTKKTLTFHMKTLHTSHRMCYPCPCCTSTFVNTWSVYRHLFKVHRMSNEQVRKLRMQIQEKAFRKETTQADDIEQNNSIAKSVESTDQQAPNETREWMNHLETDAELQRCGGCGKRFDRKAALFSHSQHCQRRIAACNEVTNKIKKSVKNSSEAIKNSHTTFTMENAKQTPSEEAEVIETSIRVENVTTLTSADWEMLGNEQSNDSGNIDIVSVSSSTSTSQDQESCSDSTQRELSPPAKLSNFPDIVCTSDVVAVNHGNKKRKVAIDDHLKTLNDTTGTDPKKSSNDIGSTLKPSSTQLRNEIDQTTVMENKIATIANLRKLQCLPCKRKFTSMTNLRRHMAIHIGWNRYRCKLCNFKCFAKYDCVAHCNKMHNAQNNRAFITNMVVEIPQKQYMCNQDVIDVTNVEENISESQPVSCSNSLNHCKTTKDTEITNIDNTGAGITEEPCSGDNGHKVSNAINNENNNISNFSKNNVNHHARTLDSDPDLKRMVMEVIFGTPDEFSSKQSDSEKSNCTNDTNSDKKLDNNESKGSFQSKDRKDSNNSTISQDDLKPQRPIRNRVKPVDKDFIYDLKEVAFRKDSIITKSATCKSLNKKSFIRWQNGEESSDVSVEQNHDLPRVVASESENVADRLEIKTRTAGLKTALKLSHVPHFTQQPEIMIIEEK